MIPTVRTARLLLRPWRVQDFDTYAAVMADPDVTRYLTGEPMNRLEAWRSMAATAGQWLLRGYGVWVVERKSDGAFVGRVGLNHPNGAEGWPGLEIAWTLAKPCWGQGYATEAARAAIAYAFQTQDIERVHSVIHIDNRASQAVATRVGETRGPRYDITMAGKSFPTEVWSMTREAWERSARG